MATLWPDNLTVQEIEALNARLPNDGLPEIYLTAMESDPSLTDTIDQHEGEAAA